MFKLIKNFKQTAPKAEKMIGKRFFSNTKLKKNPFSGNKRNLFAKSFQKNNNLSTRFNAIRKASSYATRFDHIANSIPKSSLMFVGIGSGIALAAIAAHGLSQGAPITTKTDRSQTVNLYGFNVQTGAQQTTVGQGIYSSSLRYKIASAYGYFASALGLTAVSAVALSKSPLAFKIHQNPILFLAVGVGGTLCTMIATQSISYHHNSALKHLSWAAFTGLEGFCLAPLTVLGGPLLINAALATGCIVGSISLLTAVAPSESWRQYSGVFGIGLGALMGASIGLMFFPRSNMLYNFVMYGGLALHGWGVFRSTGRMIHNADHKPVDVFDPINESIRLYIHTIGIFVRMAMMMSNSNSKRR